MNYKVMVISLVLIINFGCYTAYGQGFKDILQKTSDLDTRVTKIENSQNKLLDSIQQKLDNIEAKKAPSADNSEFDKVNEQIGSIKSDLEQVISETLQLVKAVQEIQQGKLQNESVNTLSEEQIKAVVKNIISSEMEKPGISQSVTEIATVAVQSADSVCVMEKAPALSVDANVAFLSQYIWRGIVLNKKPVLQPSLTLGYGAASLNIWSNMDMTDQNGSSNKFNELDFTFDYSSTVSSLAYSAGIMKYTFPNTGYGGSTEMYLSLSSEKTGNASLTIYQDVDLCEGTYLSLENGTSIPVGKITSLDVGGSINWGSSKHNSFYYGVDGGAVTDCLVSASATFGLGSVLSVTPVISYSALVNTAIRQTFKSNNIQRDNLFGGITAGIAF